MTTKLPDGTMDALASGELRFEDLPQEWQDYLDGKSVLPEQSSDVAVLLGSKVDELDEDDKEELAKITKDRQRILIEVEWANSQPWPGNGGAYNRLGYLAFLGIAFRVNRLFDLGVSVREFGELIGTKSKATANAVIWRILKLGLVRKREDTEPIEGIRTVPYRYDLQLQGGRFRDTHTNYSHPYLYENVPSPSLLVPDAFWTKDGLSKASLRMYEALDSERYQKRGELAKKLKRTPRSASRLLENLFSAGLAESSKEGWRRTNFDPEELAKEYGTSGIRVKLHAYNGEQRARFIEWTKEPHVPQTRGRVPVGPIRQASDSPRVAQALQRDDAPGVQQGRGDSMGHPVDESSGRATSRPHLRQANEEPYHAICTNPACEQQWLTRNLGLKCARCGSPLRVLQAAAV
jgi:predicted transcriptional regulator